VALCGLSAAYAADSPTSRLAEDFSRDEYDRDLWAIHSADAQVDVVDQQLWIQVPAGGAARPAHGIQSLAQIEGDFTLRADYSIASWPTPDKDWINVEIFIEGADGSASVMRTNHSQEGSGYALWCEPRQGDGAWKQVPTGDLKGTLSLQRKGDQLLFRVAGPADATPRDLGAVAFGTEPLTGVYFRLVVPETDSPVEVGFDNIAIEADRLIEPPRPSESSVRRRLWLGALLPLLLAGC
jgi:hypothetical protein